MQNRPFDEFDGISLLQRANLDQQTFGAFVGAEWVPKQRRWRWKGRKQNSRNKIVQFLAQLIAAMLIPTVVASDDQQNDSKECARAMRILVQEHLRRADYELIAERIKSFPFRDLLERANFASYIGKKLQAENPRFDLDRFLSTATGEAPE